MMAVEMALMHLVNMRLLERALRINPEAITVTANAASKLTRAFATHVDVLHKLRRPPVQTVRVERVNVEPGGQAVVGAITGPKEVG